VEFVERFLTPYGDAKTVGPYAAKPAFSGAIYALAVIKRIKMSWKKSSADAELS